MKLSRLSNRQLRRLLAKGEVRFADDRTIENYKKWVQKVMDSHAYNLYKMVDSTMTWGVPPEIPAKVKKQIDKAINELKKIPGLIK